MPRGSVVQVTKEEQYYDALLNFVPAAGPRLGIQVAVPADQTMLEALEEAGVGMIWDCRRGECGLCALPILEVDGIVDHRDVFFSDAEKAGDAKLCTCVSRVYGNAITVDTADR